MSPTDLAETGPLAVGQLLACALDARLTPARDAEYAQLVETYRGDPTFATTVRTTAIGMGLVVLDCTPLGGLIIVADDTSPFRMRMADYTAKTATEKRLLHGVTQLAIAALCFPTTGHLDDDSRALPSVTATEVHEFTERLCRALKERHGDSGPPADAPQLEPLWRLLLRTRATDTTTDGRSTSFTTIGMARRALRFLEEQGLADAVPRAELPDTYRMRARYRLHVTYAAQESWLLAASILGESALAATPTASPSAPGRREESRVDGNADALTPAAAPEQ